MSDILWLASYPKSGNTWMRVFLANLIARRSIEINAIPFSGAVYSRAFFDAASGVEASDLTQDEIEIYRPDGFRQSARNSLSRLFVKAHDAFGATRQGDPFFPADASFGAIYIIRNPLDVAVSYAHHSDRDVEKTISFMADDEAQTGVVEDRLSEHLPQRLMSWSSHVLSWIDQSAMPVHVVRYEDMSHSPVEAFSRAASFAGIDASALEVAEALQRSSFANLQSQELAGGFRERLISDRPFFREGKVGSWRDALTESQVERIVDRHGSVMQRFGYLSADRQMMV